MTRLAAWAARAIGLWWGFPWCPVEPDECGRVHDVEGHLRAEHRRVAR